LEDEAISAPKLKRILFSKVLEVKLKQINTCDFSISQSKPRMQKNFGYNLRMEVIVSL
jgi:hypothetical protein